MSPLVVWDLGGVLLHWDPPALVSRHLGTPHTTRAEAEALARRFFGGYVGDWAEFDRGSLGSSEISALIAQRTGWPLASVQAVVDGVPQALRADEPTLALVRALLAAGTDLRYLSNMPAPYVPVIRRRFGFLGEFAGGVFSCDVASIKPEPELYNLAARRFGRQPEQLIFIDDAVVNIEGAQAAGWKTIHYQGAADCRERLLALGLTL